MLELLWIALSECYFFLSYMSGRNAFPQKLTPVLEMRYGLGGSGPYAQREVATVLGISRSYVSRIEKHAVEKMARAYMQS